MGEPIVTVEQGQLRGKTAKNYNGDLYYSFQGIPYAKPPLGELRFKCPRPAEKWKGIRDATEDGSACFGPDMTMMTQAIIGSEDCLFLNVFTRELPFSGAVNADKPVLVFIHGGAFILGSSDSKMYNPEYLMIEDIVFVTLNYRIGLLGFLTLEDPSVGVPGNAGLKDMVLALKWIQENIAKFSGDPNNVTLFGESAGSAAVHYLYLSPSTKGLFHKAIAQSGVATNFWAQSRVTSKDVAEALDVEYKDDKQFLKYLQEISVPEKLLPAQQILAGDFLNRQSKSMAPVIEKPSDEPAILTEHPYDIIKARKYNDVPLIIGYTSEEGMLNQAMSRLERKPFETNIDFETCVPNNLGLVRGSGTSKEIAKKIKEFYFGNEEPSESNLERRYMLETDHSFFREIYACVKRQLRTSRSNIYFYRFTMDTNLNMLKRLSQIEGPGACHGDDLGYLFKNAFTGTVEPGSPEDIGIRRVVKLWTSFAKYGSPTHEKGALVDVEWEPLTKEKFVYLDIGEQLVPAVNPEADRVTFWENIYKTYSNDKEL